MVFSILSLRKTERKEMFQLPKRIRCLKSLDTFKALICASFQLFQSTSHVLPPPPPHHHSPSSGNYRPHLKGDELLCTLVLVITA